MTLGRKTGGREKGTPNRTTEQKKEILGKIFSVISSAEERARNKQDEKFVSGVVFFTADEKFLLKIYCSLLSSV